MIWDNIRSAAGTIDLTSRLQHGLAGGLEAGTFGSLEGRLIAGAGIGGGTLGVSARGARSDGFVPITESTRGPADRRAPFRQASARAIWAAPLPSGAEVQVAALGFTDQRERGVAFTSNRTDGADASLQLTGTADPLVHVSGGKATARAIPGAELVLIPGMGHDMPRELWHGSHDPRAGIALRHRRHQTVSTRRAGVRTGFLPKWLYFSGSYPHQRHKD